MLRLPSVKIRIVKREGSKGKHDHAGVELLELRHLLAECDVSIVDEGGYGISDRTFESHFFIRDHLNEQDADVDHPRVDDVFGDIVDFRKTTGFILDG